MRKPAKSTAQRAYDREKRLLLRLRKAAVKYTVAINDEEFDEQSDSIINRLTDLQASANAYSNNLMPRERRKLLK